MYMVTACGWFASPRARHNCFAELWRTGASGYFGSELFSSFRAGLVARMVWGWRLRLFCVHISILHLDLDLLSRWLIVSCIVLISIVFKFIFFCCYNNSFWQFVPEIRCYVWGKSLMTFYLELELLMEWGTQFAEYEKILGKAGQGGMLPNSVFFSQ